MNRHTWVRRFSPTQQPVKKPLRDWLKISKTIPRSTTSSGSLWSSGGMLWQDGTCLLNFIICFLFTRLERSLVISSQRFMWTLTTQFIFLTMGHVIFPYLFVSFLYRYILNFNQFVSNYKQISKLSSENDWDKTSNSNPTRQFSFDYCFGAPDGSDPVANVGSQEMVMVHNSYFYRLKL